MYSSMLIILEIVITIEFSGGSGGGNLLEKENLRKYSK